MLTFLRGKGRLTPARIILLGFLLPILLGAVLLSLPIASRERIFIPFDEALFTAVSATCVTGLVVHDTWQYWSFFGQAVILLLIQVGGMGVVTMAVCISIFTGRKIGLRQRCVMQESISAPQVGGIVRLTGFILRTTLALEGAGALLLSFRFCSRYGPLKGIWYAVFHSVSAFCNAGFDLCGQEGAYSSLTGYAPDPLVNLTVILLIITGGIGFFVWNDLREHRLRFHLYRLQTKLVLVTSLLLILIPALYFFFYEFRLPQWAGMPLGERLLASLFQAVTPRTAGFNTEDLTRLSTPSVLLTILLMLVGGSPGSTAGGVKTTTLAVLILCVRAVFEGRDSIQGFHRRLPPEILRSAVTVLMLYMALFLTGGIIICQADGVPLMAALFEAASAIGTVGLTLGITPGLGGVSRGVLMALMYFGRVGGLTLIYAVASGRQPAPAQMPQEKITIG